MRYVVATAEQIVRELPCAVAKPFVGVSNFWGVLTIFPNVIGPLGLDPLGYIFDILCSFFIMLAAIHIFCDYPCTYYAPSYGRLLWKGAIVVVVVLVSSK